MQTDSAARRHRRVVVLDGLIGPMVAAGTTPMEVYRDLRFNLDYDRETALRQAWRFRGR